MTIDDVWAYLIIRLIGHPLERLLEWLLKRFSQWFLEISQWILKKHQEKKKYKRMQEYMTNITKKRIKTLQEMQKLIANLIVQEYIIKSELNPGEPLKISEIKSGIEHLCKELERKELELELGQKQKESEQRRK